jgi:hypothetical protein
VYARRQTQPKPRKSALKSFPAPIAGWIANRALAVPNAPNLSQGASVLDNFFPTSTSVQLRRGKSRYAVLGDGSLPCRSLFSYNNGPNKRLFAANDTTIYDLTDIPFHDNEILTDSGGAYLSDGDGNAFGWYSTQFLGAMEGLTGGNWVTVQFATTGNVFLVGVNGQDTGFLYDGEFFYPNVEGGVTRVAFDALTAPFTEGGTLTGGTSGATGTIYRINLNVDGVSGNLWLLDVTDTFDDNETITDSGGSATADGASEIAAPGVTFPGGLTTADMSHVWVYKSRLWFAQKDTMNAYYMDAVDAVGGTASIFPLGGIFGQGGSLLFGASWSVDSSTDVSLSAQCVFVSDEGEAAIYQGIDPSDGDTWAEVGVYRTGKPLGNRAYFKGGGDLAIATSIGLIPLSKAISLDVTALNTASVSYNITDAWSEAIASRGMSDWQVDIWPELKMAFIAPPHPQGMTVPVMFVANTETGAWGRFTGWHGLCMEVFDGQLYFGSPDGLVFSAMKTGQDDGETYSGAVLPLFDDFGMPASRKIPTVGRAVVRASAKVHDQVTFRGDFDLTLPAAPNAAPLPPGASIWDVGIWGTSVWGAETPAVISQDWRSLGGSGYAAALGFQLTSGAVQPLDAELVRLEMMYTQTEYVG